MISESKYTLDVNKSDGVVSVCLCNDDCDYFESFIDIWVDDDENSSPFEDLDTAKQFGEVIIKLLDVIS